VRVLKLGGCADLAQEALGGRASLLTQGAAP
jgi:hypothetical protein